jgi:hypothetical protein
MAVTRIKNNQITDSTVTGSKLATKTITAGLLEDNLTYGSNLTISGNLTVSGTTTTVDTTNTLIADPLLVLSRGEIGTPSADAGLVIERGTSTNVAFIWDESADVFAVVNTTEDGTTAGDITISSYADLTVANLIASGVTLGNIGIDGNTISSTDTNGDINLTPNGSGEVIASTFTVSDLTSGRVVLAGTSGAIEDSANLTFDGTTLTVTGNANVSVNLDVAGEATLASATVSDLTSGRVVLAGTSGAIEDSANLTFDGTTLVVTGNANISVNLDVAGEATLASATVSDLTSGRIVLAGTSGAIEDSANLTFDGTTLTVSGNAAIDNVTIDGNTVSTSAGNLTLTSTGGEVTATSLAVSDLTSGRVVLAGTSGAIEDNANLTFDGTTLVVTGNANVSVDLNVTGEATLASATVSDLTSGRVVLAGTAGAIEDSANLTFDGTTLTVTGDVAVDNVTIDGNTVSTSAGNLALNSNGGEVTAPSMTVSDLTDNRIVVAGTSGSLEDDANLTWDGTDLGVTGGVNITGDIDIDNINIDGNDITSTNSNGNINITPDGTGATNITNLNIAGLTAERVMITDANGTTATDNNLTWDGTDLGVTGSLTVDNITIDGDTITSVHNTITIDPSTPGAGGTVIIEGNLQVTGTTTTIDSTVVTIADPVFQLGEDTADNLDRGIKALYNDGTAKTAFFGLDDSASEFVFIADATDSSSVFTGNLGNAAFGSLRVTDLTDTRLLLAGTSGEIEDSASLTFDGTTLAITANVEIGNVEIRDNTITTTSGNLNIDSNGNEVLIDSLTVNDLTSGRVVLAGTAGAIEDSANLTFDGTTLVVTGNANISVNLDVAGEATLASATVSDLTSGRVTLAGTSGALEDSANLTFDGTTLTVTGNVAVDNVTIDGNTVSTSAGNLTLTSTGGEVTATSLVVSDLTDNRVLIAGTSGAVEDSANLTFDGTTLTVSGDAAVDNVTIDGNTVSTSAGGLTLDSTSGETTVSDNLTVSGTLDVTGATNLNDTTGSTSTTTGALIVDGGVGIAENTYVGGTLNVTGESTLASATVSDLTSGRVVLAGTSGAIEDSANLTFDGTTLTVTGTANVSVDLNVSGEATLASAAVSDLTSGRVVLAGTSGAIEDSANLTFDGTSLSVTGNVVVDNITLDGNSITSSDALTLDAAASQSIVINEAGADVDFRVESDTEVNALFVEGTTGNIGIRTSTPSAGATLHINTTDSIVLPSGSTAERPGTPAEGMIRYNSSLGQLEFYDSEEWRVAGAEFTIMVADSFNGDGSTVAFTLSEDSTSAGLFVALNGVLQDPGTAYSVSGSTLTFTEAPASGDNIDARIITTTISVTQLADNDTSITVNDSTEKVTNTVNGTVVMEVTNAAVVPGANVTYDLGSSSLQWNTIYGKATSAQYADLAENYTADAHYEPGTVVSFGGDAEVTVNNVDADRKVAGVVSTDPAHLMNSGLEADHVVTLALQGRVPCKVIGAVVKGDLMVAAGNGFARAEADPKVGTVIGKALEAHTGGEGVIEVAVGRF